MAKSTRALSGAAKDAYLRRALATERGLDDEARVRLTLRLQEEIALVSLKQRPRNPANRSKAASPQAETPFAATRAQAPVPDGAAATEADCEGAAEVMETATSQPSTVDHASPGSPGPVAFDPFSPNVIVVIRTRGREAVLEELHSIDDVDCLRLLAREQQLGIAGDLVSASDIRLAIVAAAERRIANRRAAAS